MLFVRYCGLVLVVLCLSNQQSLAQESSKFSSLLKPRPSQRIQPFSGEVRFIGAPGYARVCSIGVALTTDMRLAGREQFRVNIIEAYNFKVSPDSVEWSGAMDSGSTFSTIFTFEPREVGTYQFLFSRQVGKGWQTSAALLLAIDEDGKTVYTGPPENCRLTMVSPHPKRDAQPLRLGYPLKSETTDPKLDRHFTGWFEFSSPPKLNETTFVKFELECHFSLYSKVQFILEHSTNIKPSELPESWGYKAGVNDPFRFYGGGFWFVPLRSGIGVLNFKVVGKRPMIRHSDRVTTEFPVYYVLGDDGKLKYIGYQDPWARFKDPKDKMLGTLKGLVETKNRDYRLQTLSSKPDYMSDENKAFVDSVKAASQDSL